MILGRRLSFKYLEKVRNIKKKHLIKINIKSPFQFRHYCKMELTEEEWKAKLTPEQYKILRLKGTEKPGTGMT